MSADPEEKQGPVSILAALRTVGSAFFGIRRGDSSRADLAKLKPIHIIVAGLFCALVFGLGLLWIVRQVVRD